MAHAVICYAENMLWVEVKLGHDGLMYNNATFVRNKPNVRKASVMAQSAQSFHVFSLECIETTPDGWMEAQTDYDQRYIPIRLRQQGQKPF